MFILRDLCHEVLLLSHCDICSCLFHWTFQQLDATMILGHIPCVEVIQFSSPFSQAFKATIFIGIQSHHFHKRSDPSFTYAFRAILYIGVQSHHFHRRSEPSFTQAFNATIYISVQSHPFHWRLEPSFLQAFRATIFIGVQMNHFHRRSELMRLMVAQL